MNKNFIIGLISCFTIFFIIILLGSVRKNSLKKNNVFINQIQSELNEKIIYKEWINNTCFLFKTDKNNAFMIASDTKNRIYESFKEQLLFDLLNLNDSIFKKANNDTIYVCHEGKEYYYVIGKKINIP